MPNHARNATPALSARGWLWKSALWRLRLRTFSLPHAQRQRRVSCCRTPRTELVTLAPLGSGSSALGWLCCAVSSARIATSVLVNTFEVYFEKLKRSIKDTFR